MKTFCFLFLFFCTSILSAQTDSIQLAQDALGLKDIRITKEQVANNRVFTASRTMNDIDELPQTIYVVTGEEILRNGYFTLTDVLKSVPGIFVSKLGSALEGETFLMNGLRGNRHAKILINNVPVTPISAAGMPIGSQLPIRQAERIEITCGPSAAIHGTNAGAGVINIVTRQSDRPVYTHADLGLGSKGWSSVNVLFGGKIGRNKRILKFNAYGSSTEAREVHLPNGPEIDIDNYEAYRYTPDPFLGFQPKANFPHESKQIGVQLDYRSVHFSLMRMNRLDHSAMGTNPLAQSYQNPQTTFGEQISKGTFIFKPNFKGFGLQSTINVIEYEIDKNSSFEYNQPFLKQLLGFASVEAANGNVLLENQYISEFDEELFSGLRYVKGRLLNLKLEQTISIFPFKNLELIFGANYSVDNGSPFLGYLEELSNNNFAQRTNFSELNTFVQGYLTLKKLNFIFGGNFYEYNPIDDGGIDRKKFLPSLSVLYKLRPNLTIRGSHNSSFRMPAKYFEMQSGQINYVKSTLADFSIQPEIRINNGWNLPSNFVPQETIYSELGLTWRFKDKIRYDGSVFYSQNKNLLNYKYDIVTGPDSFFEENVINYGYLNNNNINSNLFGIRNSVRIENVFNRLDMKINFHYSHFFGNQKLVSGLELNRVLSQPDYISGVNVSFRVFGKLYMFMEANFVGKRASSQVQTLDNYYGEQEYFFKTEKYKRYSQSTLDLMLSMPINNNFRLFCKLNNVFSNANSPVGIDATGSPDDLYSNRQPSIYLRGGVSYTID